MYTIQEPKTSDCHNKCQFGELRPTLIHHRLLCNNCKSCKRKTNQEVKTVPRQSPYGHILWWPSGLRGALLCLITSGCRYKIMLVIWDVVLIIHVDNIRTRVIQSRCGTPTPKVSLRLQQEIDRWKWPPMDNLEWFKHNCTSIWMPIFEWISRTHL